MHDLARIAELCAGRRVARAELAKVVRTHGSTCRSPGARCREQLLAAFFETRASGGGLSLLDASSLSRLRSSVGLALGGDSPEEVAFSIVPEIGAALASWTARPLRDCQGPIHSTAQAHANPMFTGEPP